MEPKSELRYLMSAVLAVMLLTGAGGCSARRTTTVTETEVERPRARYYEPPADVEVQRTETHTDVEHDEHHGVFTILADIIALPFRAVGALFSAIF